MSTSALFATRPTATPGRAYFWTSLSQIDRAFSYDSWLVTSYTTKIPCMHQPHHGLSVRRSSPHVCSRIKPIVDAPLALTAHHVPDLNSRLHCTEMTSDRTCKAPAARQNPLGRTWSPLSCCRASPVALQVIRRHRIDTSGCSSKRSHGYSAWATQNIARGVPHLVFPAPSSPTMRMRKSG